MTGDSCLARAVVPRTAAAVDHADTELIGHGGQLETPGFFVVVWENEFPAATPTCPPLFQGVAGFRECTGQRILDTKSQKLDVKKLNK